MVWVKKTAPATTDACNTMIHLRHKGSWLGRCRRRVVCLHLLRRRALLRRIAQDGRRAWQVHPGEAIAALVEHAVRTEVARRRGQSEFVRRGLASIARSEADGDWIPAEQVIAKLEAKVAAARERQPTRRG